MKRVKYLLVTILMVCLALSGCGSQSANLVPGEYMGMTFGVPESWESEEDNHSLDYTSTYGGDSPVEFSLIISLRNIAEDTALVGETDWNADVANKVIENRINGTYQYFDTYEALSTEEMVIDGHPALLHYFTIAAPDGEGKSNFENYVAGTEGQYVSILVKYEDVAQDITDTIKKDVDAFIKSIDLSNLDADAISAVWSPKSTPTPEPSPEPTPEPIEWSEKEYEDVTFELPSTWFDGDDDTGYFRIFPNLDSSALILLSQEFSMTIDMNGANGQQIRQMVSELFSDNEFYEEIETSDTIIGGRSGFVHRCLYRRTGTETQEATTYVVAVGGKVIWFSFEIANTASDENKDLLAADIKGIIESIDLSGLEQAVEAAAAAAVGTWVERECEGVNFLVPGSWNTEEESDYLGNHYSGRLSDDSWAIMSVLIQEISSELDWESEAGRSVVKETIIERNTEEENYRTISTEDIEIGGNPGFTHCYISTSSDGRDLEHTTYCVVAKRHYIVQFDILTGADITETAREELNETMEKILRSVDVSRLE